MYRAPHDVLMTHSASIRTIILLWPMASEGPKTNEIATIALESALQPCYFLHPTILRVYLQPSTPPRPFLKRPIHTHRTTHPTITLLPSHPYLLPPGMASYPPLPSGHTIQYHTLHLNMMSSNQESQHMTGI